MSLKKHISLILILAMLMTALPELGTADSVSAASTIKKTALTNHAAGSKSIKNTWKKVRGAKGYEVYRSAKKKGKYQKVKTIKKGKTTSWTNKKLKKNKAYFYKVRAYKIVKGKKKYSKFSAVQRAVTTNTPAWEWYMSKKSEKTDTIKLEITNKSRYNMNFTKNGIFFRDADSLEQAAELGESATPQELEAAGIYELKAKAGTIRPGKTKVLTYKADKEVDYSRESILFGEFKYNKTKYLIFAGWDMEAGYIKE